MPANRLPRFENCIEDEIGFISLPHGKWTIVDTADFDLVDGLPWRAAYKEGRSPYAVRRIKDTTIWMHRVILGVTDRTVEIDHIDGNGLNNRRSNLRLASSTDNKRNKPKRPGNPNKFKGIAKGSGSSWVARITVDSVGHYLGSFPTEELAAVAYDEAARRAFGEFACVNFPIGNERSAVS